MKKLAVFISVLFAFLAPLVSYCEEKRAPFGGVPQSIVVRTSENVTEGGWVWILNKAREAGVSRIYLLVKQDENDFASRRTKRTLRSGELFVALPGEKTAEGWENSDWLIEMLAKAKTYGIEVVAWWPLFNDSLAASAFPAAAYKGAGTEAFVDPAEPGVRERQERLIEKLLATYAFDGVAFDWIRYNTRPDGANGPMGARFAALTGAPWSEAAMQQPRLRAIWDEMRAASIAEWISGFVSAERARYPGLKWSAFVLPWHFKEVPQSYRRLGSAGLDDLQPMIYWADWKEGPHFTSEVLADGVFRLSGATRFRPAFDLNAKIEDIFTALGDLAPGNLSGVTWYLHQDWTEVSFTRLREISQGWDNARAPELSAAAPAVLDPPAPEPKRMGERLEPYHFAPDASVWAVVCLAELYKRKALDGAKPTVPVLTLHRFMSGGLESTPNPWVTSTTFVEQLLSFLDNAGFNVVPLSAVEAYMLSEDPSLMPHRPLALTIDDGSLTILKAFHPIAKAHNVPYAVSLITSLVKPGDERGFLEDYGVKDQILNPAEVKELAESGLVEFASHTHNLHYWGSEDETGKERRPAMTSRLWLAAEGRRETQREWQDRIFGDFKTARVALAGLGLGAKSLPILTWPYGDRNDEAADLARTAGYSAFLNFGGYAFAYPSSSVTDISRVSVTRADETIPLKMPADKLEQQRWWLAFLKWARSTKSADLIEAALDQLEGEQNEHPEAELSRAALEALRGHTGAALMRVNALRAAYPHDGSLHTSIDDFVDDYQQVL